MVAKALAAVAWRTGHYQFHSSFCWALVSFCERWSSSHSLLKTLWWTSGPSKWWCPWINPSKTSKQFQEPLVLRHSNLERITTHALARLHGKTRIWTAAARDFRQCITALLGHFGLQPYGIFTLLSPRGGATHAYTQTRGLHYVTMQGRLRDVKTSRIYLDDPRISHHLRYTVSFWSCFK